MYSFGIGSRVAKSEKFAHIVEPAVQQQSPVAVHNLPVGFQHYDQIGNPIEHRRKQRESAQTSVQGLDHIRRGTFGGSKRSREAIRRSHSRDSSLGGKKWFWIGVHKTCTIPGRSRFAVPVRTAEPAGNRGRDVLRTADCSDATVGKNEREHYFVKLFCAGWLRRRYQILSTSVRRLSCRAGC